MKYYLIAGEASGDLHASNLIKAIKRSDPDAVFRAFGGDLMEQAGAELYLHYREVALMGIVEVVTKLPTIRKHKNECRLDILRWKPDVLILIDYSGFNLPMARFAHKNNITVIYYISPKLWAWAQWRVNSVRRFVKKMFVILPFEVDFYKQHDVLVEYYGNPVLDSVTEYENKIALIRDSRNYTKGKPIVALLAGSRKQEISALLPEMLSVVHKFPGYHFIIAGAPSIPPEYYKEFIKDNQVDIVYNDTYNLLKQSVAAIVTSGTATLETALFMVPEVVVYKTNPVTLFLGRFLVKVKYFSLVNLILDKVAVKELLQKDLSADITEELNRILNDIEYREKMLSDFRMLREMLGQPGVADRVATRIYQIIKSSQA